MNKKGFVFKIIIIGIILLVVGGYFFYRNYYSEDKNLCGDTDNIQKCCEDWSIENNILKVACVGEWKLEKDMCMWECSTGLANPASKFCESKGFEVEIKENESGQYGVCIDNSIECDEWDYYRKCNNLQGYIPGSCMLNCN